MRIGRFNRLNCFALILFIMLAHPLFAQSQIVEAVIAQVNEDYIFLSELLEQEKILIRQIESQIVPEKRNETLEEMRKTLLDRLIELHLLEQKARELHVDLDARVDQAIEQIMQQNKIPDRETLKRALQQQGMDYESFRKAIRFQLLQQFIVAQFVRPKLVITQTELKEYYEKNKESFRRPVQWTFYQLRSIGDDARTTVEKWITEGMTPDSLNEVLNEDRIDITLNRIGPIQTEQLRPELREALKDANEKTWVGPITTDEGAQMWLWLDSREGGDIPPFSQIRDKIHDRLWNKKAEEIRKKTLESFKAESYIKIYIHNLPEPYRTYYANSKYAENGAHTGSQ